MSPVTRPQDNRAFRHYSGLGVPGAGSEVAPSVACRVFTRKTILIDRIRQASSSTGAK
jgi:hypothetical protein